MITKTTELFSRLTGVLYGFKASASGSIVLISGNPKPLSQRLTALSDTCIVLCWHDYVDGFSNLLI